ncbi:hypothetical protein BDAP_001308 [Binucleata daphniae]
MSSDDVSLIIKEEISYGYHNECYIYDGSVLDETCRLKELTYTIATVPKQEQSKVFDNEVKKADASMKDSNYGYNRRIEYCYNSRINGHKLIESSFNPDKYLLPSNWQNEMSNSKATKD